MLKSINYHQNRHNKAVRHAQQVILSGIYQTFAECQNIWDCHTATERAPEDVETADSLEFCLEYDIFEGRG